MVNFPVESSLSRGSLVGSNLFRPSRCLVASCCSNKVTALFTSNFLAYKNRRAVDQDTGVVPNLRLNLEFTLSMNSFVACSRGCFVIRW